MEKNYEDNDERELAVTKLYEARTIGDMMMIIKEAFPSWIVGFSDRYSDNFDILNVNWESICKMCNTEKKKVMIVEFIDIISNSQTCLRRICELLTRIGYSVRTIKDLFICGKCKLAVPCKQLEELIMLKYKNFVKKFEVCC